MLTNIKDVHAVSKFSISFVEHVQATGTVIHANNANCVAVKISVALYGGDDNKTPVKLSHQDLRHNLELFSNNAPLSWNETTHSHPLHYSDEVKNYCRPIRYIPNAYASTDEVAETLISGGEEDAVNTITYYIWAAKDAKQDYSVYPRLNNLDNKNFAKGYVDTSGDFLGIPKSVCQINTVPAIDYGSAQNWVYPSSLSGATWVDHISFDVDWSGNWSSGRENGTASYTRIEFASKIYQSDNTYELAEFEVDSHAPGYPGNYGCCNAMIFRGGGSCNVYAWHVEPSSWKSGNSTQNRIGFCKDFKLVVSKTLDNVDYWLRLNNAETYLDVAKLKLKQKNAISIYVYCATLHDEGVSVPHDSINSVAIKVTDVRGNTGVVKIDIDGQNNLSIH